jgi:hypothetical protein
MQLADVRCQARKQLVVRLMVRAATWDVIKRTKKFNSAVSVKIMKRTVGTLLAVLYGLAGRVGADCSKQQTCQACMGKNAGSTGKYGEVRVRAYLQAGIWPFAQ